MSEEPASRWNKVKPLVNWKTGAAIGALSVGAISAAAADPQVNIGFIVQTSLASAAVTASGVYGVYKVAKLRGRVARNREIESQKMAMDEVKEFIQAQNELRTIYLKDRAQSIDRAEAAERVERNKNGQTPAARAEVKVWSLVSGALEARTRSSANAAARTAATKRAKDARTRLKKMLDRHPYMAPTTPDNRRQLGLEPLTRQDRRARVRESREQFERRRG